MPSPPKPAEGGCLGLAVFFYRISVNEDGNLYYLPISTYGRSCKFPYTAMPCTDAIGNRIIGDGGTDCHALGRLHYFFVRRRF